MTLRRRAYLAESLGKMKLVNLYLFPKEVEIIADTTKKRIEEIVKSTDHFGKQAGLVKVLAAKSHSKTMSKIEQQMLSLIKSKEPIDMGSVSQMLIAASFFNYMKPSKHAAVLKLFKRGKVRLIKISDTEKEFGKEPTGWSETREFMVTK